MLQGLLAGPKKVLSPLYLPQGRGFTPLCKVLGSFHVSFGCLVGTWEETGSKTFPQHRRGSRAGCFPIHFNRSRTSLSSWGEAVHACTAGCSSKSGGPCSIFFTHMLGFLGMFWGLEVSLWKTLRGQGLRLVLQLLSCLFLASASELHNRPVSSLSPACPRAGHCASREATWPGPFLGRVAVWDSHDTEHHAGAEVLVRGLQRPVLATRPGDGLRVPHDTPRSGGGEQAGWLQGHPGRLEGRSHGLECPYNSLPAEGWWQPPEVGAPAVNLEGWRCPLPAGMLRVLVNPESLDFVQFVLKAWQSGTGPGT